MKSKLFPDYQTSDLDMVERQGGFITFAESLHQAALGKGAEHHAD